MRVAVLAIAANLVCAPAQAQDDAGAKLFKNHCGVCHTLTDDGRARQGPLLFGLFSRKAGTEPNYKKYSAGLKAAAWQWTPEQLDLWLTNPKALVADTFMSAYKQKDPAKRALVIEYMKMNGGS